MPTTKLLNYQFHAINNSQISPTFVFFIHGLFGDMNNLGVIARAFSEKYLFYVLIYVIMDKVFIVKK